MNYNMLIDREFDVFGASYNFQKAFKVSDKKYSYLNEITLKFVNFTIFVYKKNKLLGRCLDLFFQFFYIYNLITYKIRNK